MGGQTEDWVSLLLMGAVLIGRRKSKSPEWAVRLYRERVGPVLEGVCSRCQEAVYYSLDLPVISELSCEECVEARAALAREVIVVSSEMGEASRKLMEELPRRQADRN